MLKFSGTNLDIDTFHKIVQDISVLHALHIYPILVHGAGPQIEENLPKQSTKIRGIRVTSDEEIEIMKEFLPALSESLMEEMRLWQLSPRLFSRDIFSLQQKPLSSKYPHHSTGEILSIDTQSVEHALLNGIVPVFSSLVFDEEGKAYNINADEMAVHIAVSMQANKLLFFSDVEGVLDHDTNLISTIPLKKITALENSGVISGGMIPKLEACRKAIEGGVSRCHIVSGLEDGAILKEIFTPEGIGTMILEDLSAYRHIRNARKDDLPMLRKLAEVQNVLDNFADISEFFVFEIDGQIVGYIQKDSALHTGSTPVIAHKFRSIEIGRMLEAHKQQSSEYAKVS